MGFKSHLCALRVWHMLDLFYDQNTLFEGIRVGRKMQKTERTQKAGRVYIIELWRFFFCLAVLGFHVGAMFDLPVFTAGYLGVEFFLVLSGYGIGMFYMKNMKGKEVGERFYELGIYIGKRLKQLYPLYFLAITIMLFIRTVSEGWGISDVISYLKSGYAEFILMQCGPMGGEVLISADWYVAAVFWAGVIALLILTFAGKAGGLFICPLVGTGIYIYYFKLICKIDVIFSYHAVLRAVAGVCCGVFICFILDSLQESGVSDKLQSHKKLCITAHVVAQIALTLVIGYTISGHRGWKDFVVIGVYVVTLFLLLLTGVRFGEKAERVFKMLGKTTYPLYILHMPVLKVVELLIG